MENFIKKLYWGEIRPWEKHIDDDHSQAKLLKQIVDAEDELIRYLSEDGRRCLEKYQDCHSELQSAVELDRFVEGFTLGVRMMIDAVHGE